MNFDRQRVQTAIELDIGCTDLSKWGSYLKKFQEYEVSDSRSNILLYELKKDLSDLYFKGMYSLTDAINSISHGRHSWAVIKVYYAVFYFLRCSLGTRDITFLKNKGIYTLSLRKGERPERRDLGRYRGERVSGDHKTTIVTFIKLLSDTDILLSNNISEDKNVYEWLMDLRNQVNYRERVFTEPNNKYFYPALFDKSSLEHFIEEYLNDNVSVYCFDEAHAALAMPLKLALTVREELSEYIDFELFSVDKKKALDKLVSEFSGSPASSYRYLYNFGKE